MWGIPVELRTWWSDTRVNLGRDRPERIARFLRSSRVSSELLQQRIVDNLVRVFITRWHHAKQRIVKQRNIIYSLRGGPRSIARKSQKSKFLTSRCRSTAKWTRQKTIRTLGAKAYNRALPTMTSETMKDYKGCKLTFHISAWKGWLTIIFVRKKRHRDFFSSLLSYSLSVR